jgi:hypothetical protein
MALHSKRRAIPQHALLPGLLRSIDGNQFLCLTRLRNNKVADEFVKHRGVKLQQSNVFLPNLQWS